MLLLRPEGSLDGQALVVRPMVYVVQDAFLEPNPPGIYTRVPTKQVAYRSRCPEDRVQLSCDDRWNTAVRRVCFTAFSVETTGSNWLEFYAITFTMHRRLVRKKGFTLWPASGCPWSKAVGGWDRLTDRMVAFS